MMDEAPVFDDIPKDQAWWDLRPTEKHRWLVKVTRRTLAQIELEGREPDLWESHCLSAALGYGCVGFYTAGLNLVVKAFTPTIERAPPGANDGPLIPLNDLELGLKELEARPKLGNEQRPA
jgi:hypothetical protein